MLTTHQFPSTPSTPPLNTPSALRDDISNGTVPNETALVRLPPYSLPRSPAFTRYEIFKSRLIYSLAGYQRRTSSVYAASAVFRDGARIITIAVIYLVQRQCFSVLQSAADAGPGDSTSLQAPPLQVMASQNQDEIISTALWNLGRVLTRGFTLLTVNRNSYGVTTDIISDARESHFPLHHQIESLLDLKQAEGSLSATFVLRYSLMLKNAMLDAMNLWVIAVNSVMTSFSDQVTREHYLDQHLHYLTCLAVFEDDLHQRFVGHGYKFTQNILALLVFSFDGFLSGDMDTMNDLASSLAPALATWDLEGYRFKLSCPDQRQAWQLAYYQGITPIRKNFQESVSPSLIPNYLPAEILAHANRAQAQRKVIFDIPAEMATRAKPRKCTHSEGRVSDSAFQDFERSANASGRKGEIAEPTARPAEIATDILSTTKLNQTCQSCRHSKIKCVKQDPGKCANCEKKGVECVATACKRGSHKPRLALWQVLQPGDVLLYHRMFARGGRTLETHTVHVTKMDGTQVTFCNNNGEELITTDSLRDLEGEIVEREDISRADPYKNFSLWRGSVDMGTLDSFRGA